MKSQDNYIDPQGIDPTQKVDGLFAIILHPELADICFLWKNSNV